MSDSEANDEPCKSYCVRSVACNVCKLKCCWRHQIKRCNVCGEEEVCVDCSARRRLGGRDLQRVCNPCHKEHQLEKFKMLWELMCKQYNALETTKTTT